MAFEEQQPKAAQGETSEWSLKWALETMSAYGVLPTDTYLMTIAEVNLFLAHRSYQVTEESIATSWRTINFLGAFLSDKFQNLERYLPENPKRKAANEAKKAKTKEKLLKITSKR